MDTTIARRRHKAEPTLGPYNEGIYNWAVYYVGEDGKRVRRKFVSKGEATAFLADKEVETENLGTRIAATLDDDVKREAFAALALLKRHNVSLLDAAKQHCAHLEATTHTASSTPDAPRIRVIVEAAGLPVAVYPAAVKQIAARLGIDGPNKESLIAVQPMYLPVIFRK
jgi:hypothetical protein